MIRARTSLALAATSLLATAGNLSAGEPTMTEVERLVIEEKWVFEPQPGREDIFYDQEAVKKAQFDIQAAAKAVPANTDPATGIPRNPNSGPEQAVPIDWAKSEERRIAQLLARQQFADVIRSGDLLLKALEKHAAHAEIAPIITTITGYRTQADEALTRQEAQAQFDALAIQVEGIMWVENGKRLAIIAGEPKAVGITDRVKDCVVVNIDTDQVVFRLHIKHRRFEFPAYVGEAVRAKNAAASRPQN